MVETQKLGTTTDYVYDISYWYIYTPPPLLAAEENYIKYSLNKVRKNRTPDKFHQLTKPWNVIAKISPLHIFERSQIIYNETYSSKNILTNLEIM